LATVRNTLVLAVACVCGAIGLLAPATAAAAPALGALKPCYVSYSVDPVTGEAQTEPVPLSGSGFTPNSRVTVTVDGITAVSDVPVDAAGNLPSGTVQTPLQEKGQRAFTVNVTEQGNPAQTASATTLVTALSVSARPKRARPTSRITWSGRGFTLAKPVWAHYVRGGKVRRTVRFSPGPQTACGTFQVKARQFPFVPRVGLWKVQIDQQRRWSRHPASPFVSIPVYVREEIKLKHR
jgi:hypothetical protein